MWDVGRNRRALQHSDSLKTISACQLQALVRRRAFHPLLERAARPAKCSGSLLLENTFWGAATLMVVRGAARPWRGLGGWGAASRGWFASIRARRTAESPYQMN